MAEAGRFFKAGLEQEEAKEMKIKAEGFSQKVAKATKVLAGGSGYPPLDSGVGFCHHALQDKE